VSIGDEQRQLAQEMQESIRCYPADRRVALAIMQDFQKRYRYLSKEALELIAEHVGAPLTTIYSVATFYKSLSLVPRGRVALKVCDGTACHVRGSDALIGEAHICLGIEPGETTHDGEFSLETVNCVGACALGPLIVVEDEYHGHMTAKGFDRLVHELRDGEQV
jgi:NADH-quinone oxidoreductase subunit E